MGRWVALLRAVNVGGRKVPMEELRTLCAGLGWANVATYIQSGNIVFSASGGATALADALERALQDRFGIAVPVIVRSAAQWSAYPPSNPFADAARDEPNRLMLLLSKKAPAPGCDEALQARARDGERVRLVGDALWVHFPGGSARSKLTPGLFDRLIGSPATSRNWRTVLKLQEMASA